MFSYRRTVLQTIRRVGFGASLLLLVLALLAPLASASEMIDRNTKKQRLLVNKKGTALDLYKARGASKHVAYWGAKNTAQLFFSHDRSGGVRSGKGNPNNFRNACKAYTGPPLQYAVASCTMPDGSHWALQQWVRIKANGGGQRGDKELRISHWTGALPVLTVTPDWSWRGRYNHIYGTLTFHGKPWYAETWDHATGEIHDGVGRNFAIESYNSDMGSGWRRVNAFLTHKPSGEYCFGFAPKDGYTGRGDSTVNKYRALVPGPAVTPDVFVSFGVLGLDAYTYDLDQPHNDAQAALVGDYQGLTSCRKIN
ncbi:MAG: hypothetical protein H7123_05000 [Thermoleophilia bacterium]|nr:hypothetical protein [Thermoleophilia bacterium]